MIKLNTEKKVFYSKYREYTLEDVPLSLVYEWVKTEQLSKLDFISFVELYKVL